MHLSPTRRFAFALGLGLVATQVASAQQCLTFSGLEHCPLGSAQLSISAAGLQANNLTADGKSGVRVALPEATSFVAAVNVSADPDQADRLQLDAEAGGEVISTAVVAGNADGNAVLSGSFTGGADSGTVSVLIRRAGTLVGSSGGGPKDGEWVIFNQDEDFVMWLIGQWTFFNRLSNGGCGWVVNLEEAVAMRLPNGEVVTGDEIEVIEEVIPGGHYPYTSFDGISLRATSGSLGIVMDDNI